MCEMWCFDCDLQFELILLLHFVLSPDMKHFTRSIWTRSLWIAHIVACLYTYWERERPSSLCFWCHSTVW